MDQQDGTEITQPYGDPQNSAYQPPTYVQMAHESKPKWATTQLQRRTYAVITAVAAVVLVGGCVALANGNTGNTSTASTQSGQPAQIVQSNTSAASTTAPAPTATSRPTATATIKPTPTLPSFHDGTFQVGKDIQPGTYRLRTAPSGCYYARLKGFSGSLDDIIANENTDAPAIVTIASTDKGFQSERCGTWTENLSPITQSKTEFSSGMYIVGTDILPGTYKSSGSQGCYYARLSGFGNTLDDIIINNNTDSVALVTISASDKGFQSTGCGTWTKQ